MLDGSIWQGPPRPVLFYHSKPSHFKLVDRNQRGINSNTSSKMDPKSPLVHLFQKPTVENLAILEEYINRDVKTICAKNQDSLIITAIFTMIAELPDIRQVKRYTSKIRCDFLKKSFLCCGKLILFFNLQEQK